jgi:ATP-binding cassette subfamily F protein 2
MNPPIIWTKTIDALTDALNEWDPGLVPVSHDFRLINQVAKEIVITL